MKKKTGPPALEVTSADQAKELIGANKVIVFGFFPNQETVKAKAFLNTAGLIDDQVFAIVSDEKVIKELEGEAEDVVLYKDVSYYIIFIIRIIWLNSCSFKNNKLVSPDNSLDPLIGQILCAVIWLHDIYCLYIVAIPDISQHIKHE